MELLGPLPKTKSAKCLIVVIIDGYSKLTPATPMNDKTAPLVAVCVLKNLVLPYGIPNSSLVDNDPNFVAQFFRYVCAIIGINGIPITAYHTQSNGQPERYNKFVAGRLLHYVCDHQTDWNLYV